jgi:hypothetical protein|nr:MAG TPA: hypothetical protein [Caudoviricetes sp.]
MLTNIYKSYIIILVRNELTINKINTKKGVDNTQDK